MSNVPNYNPNNFPAARPQHHLHDSSEPLPGAGGTKATTDYDMNADTNQSRAGSGPQDRLAEYGSSAPESTTSSRQDRPAQVSFEDQTRGYDPAAHDTGASARGSEGLYQEKPLGDRPLGVQPARQGTCHLKQPTSEVANASLILLRGRCSRWA